jgi:hypothetical protein
MKSSVFITTDKIEVIGFTKAAGPPAVNDYLSAELPEGTLINGKIIDTAAFEEALAEMKAKAPRLFANASLTVDGSSVFTKKIRTPRLSRRRMLQLVIDEFSDSADGGETEMLYDYITMKNTHSVLACSVDKSQVDSYRTSFANAGIKLKAVRIGVESILHYVQSRKDLQDSTFVINAIDSFTMLSMVFHNGENMLISRTRLFGDSNIDQLNNALQNLSGLVQFMKSEKIGEIGCSYYLGPDNDDIIYMGEINPYPDIEIAALDVTAGVTGHERLPASARFGFLNTMQSENSINLLNSGKELKALEKSKKPKNYIPLAAAVVAAALAVPSLLLLRDNIEIDRELNDLRDFLNDPYVAEKKAELSEIEANTVYYSDILKQAEMKNQWDMSRAKITAEILDYILGAAVSVRLENFTYSEASGVLSVTGSSANQSDVARYVETLKRNELIEWVGYSGYGAGGEGRYSFSIQITLAYLGEETDEEEGMENVEA